MKSTKDLTNSLLQRIIHKDKNIIAINKPPFLPIHGSYPGESKPVFLIHLIFKRYKAVTLVGILDQFNFGNKHKPFIVHRLDKVF